MISVQFKSFNEFTEAILPSPSANYSNNTQLLMEFTLESNKEEFLGEYIKYLIKKDVYTLLFTQEGNASFYLKDFSDSHIITIELTVLESPSSNYEFKKFGQIPMNENKILYVINNVLREFGGKKPNLVVFDSISDIILWYDFTTAYKFVRKCVSNLRRTENTHSIFLISKTSHSEKELSAHENLFDGILVSEGKNECSVRGGIKYRYILT